MKPHISIALMFALFGVIYTNGAYAVESSEDYAPVDIEGLSNTISYSNKSVTPASNYDSNDSKGGAISSTSNIIFNDYDRVSFTGNCCVSSRLANAKGGAIYSNNVNIFSNTSVSFIRNYSTATVNSSYGASGGAIYSTGTININANSDVDFSNNYAVTSSNTTSKTNTYGGVIYSSGSINIQNNGNVNFTKNYASNSSNVSYNPDYNSYGGAIYSTGSISIQGNESVVFMKNYEQTNRTLNDKDAPCLLRSIYMAPNSSSDTLTLSAKTDGNITFYDSVYMGNYSGAKVNLNSNYQDEKGVTQLATGDIIFSGKYTQDHLKEIKGGTAGTSKEIANSRTSELLNTVNLYGGTLRVEDKAVLKTHAINVSDGSNATIKVADADVNASGYDITVNKTGTLEIGGTNGSSKVTANNINIEKGAMLALTRTAVATEENVVITLAAVDSISIYNDKTAGIVSSSNLNIAGGAALKADGVHLSMDGGILNFLATTENKTNLVLTLGAEYDPNSQIMLFSDVDTVKFLQDNITATSNSAMVTLNASDYFTGDWVNDKTILVYDKGNIYVSGVNVVIPEPATTTLSLLALAALAARRRRK